MQNPSGENKSPASACAAVYCEYSASWIENFLGVLVSPRQVFTNFAQQAEVSAGGLVGAAFVVILVSVADCLVHAGDSPLLLFLLPFSVFGGLVGWFGISGVVSTMAYCFGQPQSRIRGYFVSTGWSFLPWLLVGPMMTYSKAFGGPFHILPLVPYFWVVVLMLIAVKTAFELTERQTFLFVLAVPAMVFFVQLWFSLQLIAGLIELVLAK